MDRVLDNYPDRSLRIVFEAYMPLHALRRINGITPGRANAFNFTRLGIHTPWNAKVHALLLRDYYATLPANSVPNQVNGNHDRPRIATRWGERAARAAALINLTLPGEIYIYNGEEGAF